MALLEIKQEDVISQKLSVEQFISPRVKATTLTGNDITNFLNTNENKTGPSIEDLAYLYMITFGLPPWGEGAYNVEYPNVTLSLPSFLKLDDEDKSKFDLFYHPQELINRFKSELSLIKQSPFIVLLTPDYINNDEFDTQPINSNFIIGSAFGVETVLKDILIRIGNANYSQNNYLQRIWDSISIKLEQAITKDLNLNSKDKLIYIDDIFIHPRLQGTKGYASKILSNVFQYITSRGRVTPNRFKSVNVMFRTTNLPSSKMYQFSEKVLVPANIMKPIYIKGDTNNIVYYYGQLKPELIASLANNSENIFGHVVNLSKQDES